MTWPIVGFTAIIALTFCFIFWCMVKYIERD